METMNATEVGVDTLRIEGNPAQLYEALAKAQGEFPDIPRLSDGQAGSRKFRFAGYATIIKCIRPALTKYGITVLQPLHSRDEPVTTTILAGHGAAIISSLSFPPQKDPQEFGKQHTYYRRYQLQAMLGLEGDKDADESDIPVATQGYSEPAAAPKKEEPKAKAPPAPKANGESAAKPVATASGQKTNGSVKASEPTTNGAAPNPQEIVDGIAPEKLNGYLSAVMKQMDPPWKVIDIRKFYAEHFDAENEMPAPDAMDPALKRQILTKIIEVKKVAPF